MLGTWWVSGFRASGKVGLGFFRVQGIGFGRFGSSIRCFGFRAWGLLSEVSWRDPDLWLKVL